MWEQVDRAGIDGVTTAGTALLSKHQDQRRAFRQFGVGTDIPLADSLKYHSPGLNLATTNPTRVFPDMGQILANNTNAATGTCPDGAAGAGGRPDGGPRVLRRVPADRRTGSAS